MAPSWDRNGNRPQVMRLLIIIVFMTSRLDIIMMCPLQCICSSLNRNVECSNINKPQIPPHVPCETISFTQNNNLLQKITKDSLPCQRNLETLVLENNMLTIIEDGFFNNLHSLTKISLRGNLLTSFPSKPVLSNLRNIDLSYNLFTKWPIQLRQNQLLRYLRFNWNPLEEPFLVPYQVNLAEFKGLSSLEVSSRIFAYPQSITNLVMSNGRFEVVGSLSKFSSLNILILSHNRIRTIFQNSFQNLTRLEILDLSHNHISDVSAIRNLPSLKTLDLENNLITSIGVELLKNIETIILILNRIAIIKLPDGQLARLVSITLNHNVMVPVSNKVITHLISSSPSLLNINVAENYLEELIIGECFILKYLYAYNNSIRQVRFDDAMMCSSLQHLDLSGNRLTDLTNIKNLTGLRSLYVHSNQISHWNETGLVHLPNLKFIRLEGNLLKELHQLPSLPHLIDLNLSYNSINWISRESLVFSALQTLDLTGNSLKICPFLSRLNSLTKVYLNSNQLNDIEPGDIGSIKTVQHLHMAGNKLNDIPFLPVNHIIRLNIEYNNISVIQNSAFENYLNLEILLMKNNQLKRMPFFPTTLRRLHLEGNQFERTNNFFRYQPGNINYLSLRRNEMSSMDDIYAGPSLTYLDVSHNALLKIQPFHFFFAGNIQTLHLENNALSNVTEETLTGLTSINFIYLQWNQLTYLPHGCFSSCPELTFLDISGNPLQTISDSTLSSSSKLQYLNFAHVAYLQSNLYSTLFLSELTSLRDLFLSNNSIVNKWSSNSTSLVVPPQLSTITFSRNALSNTFPTVNRECIRNLDLSHNSFYSVPEQLKGASYPVLRRLRLTGNKIRIIGTDDFSGFLRLYFLYLDYNELIVIQKGTFSMHLSMPEIDMSSNNLSVIHESSFPLSSRITRMDLSGNPWHCDCHLYAFTGWLSVKSEGALCATPLEQQNRTISDAIMDEVCDDGNKNITCLTENPIITVYVDDLNVTLPCPLDVIDHSRILWSLPDKVVLHTHSSSPSHHITINDDGSIFLEGITEDLSGNYSCMAPQSGVWTEFSLTLIVIAHKLKDDSKRRFHNAYTSSEWVNELKCDGGLDQSKDLNITDWLVPVIVFSVFPCFILAVMIGILIRRNTTSLSSTENQMVTFRQVENNHSNILIQL